MNMLQLVTSAGPETVIDTGREVSEKVLASGHETWGRVSAQITDLVGG